MRRSPVRLAALLAALAILAGACSGGASPKPSGAAETTIYFASGTTQAEVYLLPVIISARQILKDQGISLEYAALSNDEVVEAAIDRGRVDVALLSLLGAERAVKAGLHMKWTLTNELQNTFVLVVRKDVTDLKQLKGKKIGVQDPTSLSTIVVPGLMKTAGLGASDYEMTYLAGSSNRAAALTAGTLDAAILFRQVAATLVGDSGGAFQIWGGGATAMAPMMWEGFVMSDAFRANTKLSVAFVKAAMDAYKQFYAGDPATMAAAMLKDELPETAGLEVDPTKDDFVQYQAQKLFPTDGGVAESYYTPMTDLLVSVGQLKTDEVLPYKDVIDPSLVDAALK